MKIALAADHGGLELKNHLLAYLSGKGYECKDFGTNNASSVDYPDYAKDACNAITGGECGLGLLICTTGVGMSMAANKIHGIRACCCSDIYSAEMTKKHNNANVLCLGQNVVGKGLAEKLVDIFIGTDFESDNERHVRRVEKLGFLEK